MVGDFQDPWEFGAILLLLAGLLLVGVLILAAIPEKVAQRLDAGDVARNLERIGSAAAEASRRVQRLDDELAASEKLGEWRTAMHTALGAVIGLAGGFLGPWVSDAGVGTGICRAVAVILGGVLIVALMSLWVFPHFDARIRDN